MKDHLPDRWRRILQRHAAGEDFRCAAKAEGCSPSYVKVLKTRMWKNHAAVKYLEEIRADARTVAVYGLVEAMAQAQEGIDFAKQSKSAMAFIQGCTLKAKLAGLLVDKVAVVPIDLRGALEAAHARVKDVTPPVSAKGPISWRPLLPGNSVADPEAGPEDESARPVCNGEAQNRG